MILTPDATVADALALSVPASVLIDIPSDVPVDDPHQELGELLHRSVGPESGVPVHGGCAELPADRWGAC